jgi:hypothetical protein
MHREGEETWGERIPDNIVLAIWSQAFYRKPMPKIEAYNQKPEDFFELVEWVNTMEDPCPKQLMTKERAHVLPLRGRRGCSVRWRRGVVLTFRDSENERFIICRKCNAKRSVQAILYEELQGIFDMIDAKGRFVEPRTESA